MDAQEHLFYGLGMVAYAVASADGSIQASERRELHEIIDRWTKTIDTDFDVSEVIFSVLSKNESIVSTGFDEGMKYIRLGSNHLTERLKERFIYLIQDIAHAFPPVTSEEEDVVTRFKRTLHDLH